MEKSIAEKKKYELITHEKAFRQENIIYAICYELIHYDNAMAVA